jgi:2-dehydro-3-deoxyglucarate aldolase/4-hydroxy-2-oxoheptanedioate aldolase
MNLLKEKIRNGEKIRGTLVCMTDPCLCEIMGRVGFDCVWIDTEHTYMSERDVLCHLNAARSVGIASLVRLPQHDLTATKRILEMGPDGILFPMVTSLAEFNDLMDMTLYPPLGKRGFGPMRAIAYGAEDAKEYVTRGQLEMCRFMQIEHLSMIAELEEIASNPYLDGFIFGPNDLSGSLGEFLNVFGDTTMNEIRKAIEIARRHGKCVGLAGGFDEATIRAWSSLGLDMLFAGGDWNFIFAQGKTVLDRLTAHM